MINAVILASGFSKRMGKNKLIQKINNKYLIEYIVETVMQSNIDQLIVVYRDEIIKTVLEKHKNIKFVYNNSAENGQSEGIKHGINCGNREGNYIFFVGDQPLISVETINLIIEEHLQTRVDIVVPMYGDKRGNPVFFSNKMLPELLKLNGDEGGRQVLRKNEKGISYVYINNSIESLDVDTPEDLEHIKRLIKN